MEKVLLRHLKSYFQGSHIKVSQERKAEEFHLQPTDEIKGLRQIDCFAAGRLVQTQKSQLIPRAKLNEQSLTSSNL